MSYTQKCDRDEELSWSFFLLQEICQGILTAYSTPHRPHKKGAFVWNEKAQVVFEEIQQIMSSCIVLALLDFTQPFVLKYDASREGIRVVLMQNHHLIAFERKKLREHERLYSIYDKEMLDIMHALAKFR